MKSFPTFSMKQLIDSGVHYGHKTARWNPKMAPFLFGIRQDTHIIDLNQTVSFLQQALQIVKDTVRDNGRVLFVGTKRQASDIIADSAKRCGQYYINYRWLAGMLTNWNTVSLQIKTLVNINNQLEREEDELTTTNLTKKEKLYLTRRQNKLDRSLGGIMDMGGKPDLLFVIDTNKEDLAIKEAMRLKIPIIAILDSNSNPDGINYPIPGNDDATRAIKLYCKLISDAALAGIQESLTASGADIGAMEDEDLVEANLKKLDQEKSKFGKKPFKKRKLVSENNKDVKLTEEK